MNAVRQVVLGAWRRVVWLRSLRAGLDALSCVFALLALLLLAGTGLLGWAWFAALTLLVTAGSAWQVWRKLPDPYAIAQGLDRSNGLQDALSTAWHLDQRGTDSPAARFQQQWAEGVAARADARAAFPVRVRREAVCCSLLAVTAAGLAVVRYAHAEQLDLHRPLLTLWLKPATDAAPAELESRPSVEPAHGSPKTLDNGLQVPDPEAKRGATQEQRSPDAEPGNAATDSSAEQGHQPGVFQRMKDALSDLMDQLKPGANTPLDSRDSNAAGQSKEASTQGTSDKAGSADQKQNGGSKEENLAQSGSAEKPSGEREGSQQQSGAKAKQGEGGLSQSEASKSEGNGNSPQSGAGSENGSQRIVSAAELRAMGKIEQILGQRGSQVSGDMTIVNSSGPQHLKTEFTGQDAAHRDVDTPAVSDRIAPEDRDFVRGYMDEMHRLTDKQEAAAHAAH